MLTAHPFTLPAENAVWAEANAALLDRLRRGDSTHALQRLARACVHLLGNRECHLEALDERGQPVHGGLFEASRERPGDARPVQHWQTPLTHHGIPVGRFTAELPAGADTEALALRLLPLLEAAGALLGSWLAERDGARRDSLSLTRTAMREGGTFVWEWDLATDSLGDIDEGGVMLGYPPNAIGHTQADWDLLIHPEDFDAVEAAYQAHARGETESFRAVYRAKAADGSWRWVEERGRVVERDVHGRPTRMFGTQTDATVQHALEQARQDQLTAEAANAAKTQFLSRVSHELRTPLNAVLGFSQLMEVDQQEPLTDGQRRRVNLIHQAGDYLLAMIGDLLDLSLVESGRLPMQAEPVPLPALAHDCLDLLRGQAAAADVHLRAGNLPAGLVLRADPMRLKQVLINLLNNGIKYNRSGGCVEISARIDGGFGVIDVRDTGIGLPEDQLDKLFLPFQRLGRETGAVEGSGLGLALSQALVQAMGGQLSAHPLPAAEGPGTVFRVSLPLVPPAV
ncbi:MAG TPA: PAS domain-containing sensor histidine kinase [Ideonella sp.]|uniref:sensor histidine kinase n=1 Tax=Ideonella sp. TaxID=1929293 RepID=UPI002E367D5B|nr:PAS domain-containing sensor histidine kinase [Ideonella sp.]HEX5688154.1 PAS domain-containing sensor histidine kinase [Ideonella sp.]